MVEREGKVGRRMVLGGEEERCEGFLGRGEKRIMMESMESQTHRHSCCVKLYVCCFWFWR